MHYRTLCTILRLSPYDYFENGCHTMKHSLALTLLLSLTLSACGGSDSSTPDPEVTDPEVTDPEVTDPEVTDPVEGNLYASITDTSGGDGGTSGFLKYNIVDNTTAAVELTKGAFSVDVIYPADQDQDFSIGLFDSSNSTSGQVADIVFKTKGRIATRVAGSTVDTAVTHIPGETNTIVVTWDAETAQYTAMIGDTEIFSGDFNNTDATGVAYFGFKLASDSKIAADTSTVDNILLYSDTTMETLVFNDDFEDFLVGEELDGNGDVYSGNEAVVGGIDSDAPEVGTPPVIADLDPNAPPSENFDLSYWNLSVPIDNGEGEGYAKATTIKVADLVDYELKDVEDLNDNDYFYTNTTDGGMVFRDYVGGARTSEGTSYSRTEFREMLRGTDTSIKTQGVNKNNWVFGNAPADQQTAAGAVDGNMTATLSVDAVTSTGDSSQQGRVIVGQIHAASDEPIRLYYRLLPGHTKGSIYFAHEPSNGNDEQWYEMIGSRSTSASEPSDGIALGEVFSYEIDVVGTDMTVSLMREGKATIIEEVDMINSGYDGDYVNSDGETVDDYMYFKAGVYNQNNSGEATDYVQATFYELTVTH